MGVTWSFGTQADEGDTTASPTSEQSDLRELPATKVCPRCGAELFRDMGVCYECLYDFDRPPVEPSFGVGVDDLEEPDGVFLPARSGGSRTVRKQDTAALSPSADPHGLSLLVRAADVELSVPLPQGSLIVGRDSACDIVLRRTAVSREHVRVSQEGGEVMVEDLGATNPARLRGRSLQTRERLRVGDTLDVCGTFLTLLGPTR